MCIGKQIELLMKQRKISRYKLSRETGLPYTTLTQILNGRTKDPQVGALEKIAEYFNKPFDYLLGNSVNAIIENRLNELGMSMEELSKKSKTALVSLQSLDQSQPAPWDYEPGGLIDRLANALEMDRKELVSAYARQEPPAYDGPRSTAKEAFGVHESDLGYSFSTHPEHFVSLPVVGRISCGNGTLAYEEIEGYEVTPSSWLNGGEYFYLRAKGDSMTGARIQDGDLLLIRRQEEVEDGEIAAVLIGNEALLKRVFTRGNSLLLQSENPKYAPILLGPDQNDDVRILGKLKKIVVSV